MDTEPQLPEDLQDLEVEKSSAVGPVFLTLLVLTLIGGLIYLPSYAEKEPLKGILSSDQWWVPNVGEYHPLILHLPIGIVALTLFMEVCRWLSFGRYRPMTGLALFVAFISGVFACVTGFVDLNVDGRKADDWDDDMFKHMWMGIGFVSVLGLTLLAKVWGRRGQSRGFVYSILLLISAGAMGYGAHFGGLATHRVDPVENTLIGLEVIPPKEKKARKKSGLKKSVKVEKAAGAAGAAGEGQSDVPPKPDDSAEVGPKSIQDRLAFEEVVLPIMGEKCLYCHSEESGKSKGDLLMDTYENLLIGGYSQDGDDYRTLVPGDAEQSYMIEVMNLPMDDDMHMPPSKKKQMEAHEIELITWWVNSIPASETLTDQTLAEMGAPAGILKAAAMMVSPEEREAMEAEEAAAQEKIEEQEAVHLEKLETVVASLKQDPAFATALNYAFVGSSDLEFSSVSLREKLDDQTFLRLAPVRAALTKLGLAATSVTEETLMSELPKMAKVRELDLSQTQISDRTLEAVGQLQNLERLNLYGTNVTDQGIAKLKGLTNLKKIYLWQTNATLQGVEELKKELPGLEYFFGVK